MARPDPPTIVVHGSRAIPLVLLAAAGCALGAAVFVTLQQGALTRELALIFVVAVVIGILAGKRARNRPVQMAIASRGVDIISQQTGLVRWDEMVHVSLFTIPPDGADGLALFITQEAAQRLPPSRQHRLPEFANVVDGTQYLVLYARDLEYPLSEVLAEIEARRLGQTGPLTKKVAG